MLSDNIKRARIQKGMSQEELATKIHVVRQTVSKYENGLSVPDAEMLMRIAKQLDVSVGELLGIGMMEAEVEAQELAKELERLNKLLIEKNEKSKLMYVANRKRGMILFLSFLSLVAALAFQGSLVSLVLLCICLLSALAILLRNLSLLTSITTENLKTNVLRFATIFDALIFVIAVVFIILSKIGMIGSLEENEEIIAVAITMCVIIVFGIISPKLPFTRHTGLRLPWTVQDEETWNLAHKVIGYISPPTILFYIAALLIFDDLKTVSICVFIAWVVIPSVTSLIYYLQKNYRGRNQ